MCVLRNNSAWAGRAIFPAPPPPPIHLARNEWLCRREEMSQMTLAVRVEFLTFCSTPPPPQTPSSTSCLLNSSVKILIRAQIFCQRPGGGGRGRPPTCWQSRLRACIDLVKLNIAIVCVGGCMSELSYGIRLCVCVCVCVRSSCQKKFFVQNGGWPRVSPL